MEVPVAGQGAIRPAGSHGDGGGEGGSAGGGGEGGDFGATRGPVSKATGAPVLASILFGRRIAPG